MPSRPPPPDLPRLIGVDFTSTPTAGKPITVARGSLHGTRVTLQRIDALTGFPAFEALLREPGPWLGAFDFPFGLPRELVETLDWPTRVARAAAALRQAVAARDP